MKNYLHHYASEGYKKVDGWGVDEELIEIFRLINDFHKKEAIYGSLCEIGVHHGRTLILFGLLANPSERVIGIDLFEDGQSQNLDLSGSGSLMQLKENLKLHAPEVKFEIIKGNSFALPKEVLNSLQNSRIIHIDGGHFLEVVLNDLTIAQNAIGIGGIIVIDDYWHSGFPEVQEAVHRYFWSNSLLKAVPFAVGKNKIFLVGISYKTEIIEYFRNRFPTQKQKLVRVLGYDAICIDPH